MLFTVLAAALFPIPMTILAAKGNLSFDWLCLNVGLFGYFLLLPTVLGILGAMLFFAERDNGTQKNINVIPVSTLALLVAKVITILLFSLVYSLATSGASLLGGCVIGNADHVLYRLWIGGAVGILVALAVLPIMTIEFLCKKGYVFSIILSFVYASANFLFVLSVSKVLSPLSAVFRWALPRMTTKPTSGYGLEDWFVSTFACVGILLLTVIASLALAVIVKKKQEI